MKILILKMSHFVYNKWDMYKYKNIVNLLTSRYGVITISDFKNIKTNNIRKYLNRSVQKGELINIKKGLFYKPTQSKLVPGLLSSPDDHQVAGAIARKNGWDIVPYGWDCLNKLHLSTQVSYSNSFASTGPSRKYIINGIIYKFYHCSNNYIVGYDMITRMIIQSIRTLGPKNYNDEIIDKLVKTLKSNNINLKRANLRTPQTITLIMERIYRKINA